MSSGQIGMPSIATIWRFLKKNITTNYPIGPQWTSPTFHEFRPDNDLEAGRAVPDIEICSPCFGAGKKVRTFLLAYVIFSIILHKYQHILSLYQSIIATRPEWIRH